MSIPSPFCCHALRLKPGDDLVLELSKFAKTLNSTAVFVLTCVGSLQTATLRTAAASRDNKSEFIQCNRDTEIVSLVGTLSRESQPHLHISLSDETGKVIGGHLPSSGGAIVRTTAEVVLGASSDLVFTRKYDEETGFDELVVGQ